MSPLRFLVPAVALAAALLFTAWSIGAPAVDAATARQGAVQPRQPAQEAPQELKEAIQQWVEDDGEEYAGDCTEINRDGTAGQNVGKMCSMVLSLSDDTAEVGIGLVASNDITVVTFNKANGAWEPGAERPGTAGAPSTGTGGELGEASSAAVTWGGVAALATAGLALATGGLALARRTLPGSGHAR
jgi:hypothetical protein